MDFQEKVGRWARECFGEERGTDEVQRRNRFAEEALELLQACGGSRNDAHQLVDYVFDRPVGDIRQEVGGTMVTLAALCAARSISMTHAGDAELDRCEANIEKIRAKDLAKPAFGPLPGPSDPDDDDLRQALQDAINVMRRAVDDDGVEFMTTVLMRVDEEQRVDSRIVGVMPACPITRRRMIEVACEVMLAQETPPPRGEPFGTGEPVTPDVPDASKLN